ncbi:cytochrome P450 [Crassisporium funariophilum]|nr:cytochrome P450 [Crassisporium funariophilum]
MPSMLSLLSELQPTSLDEYASSPYPWVAIGAASTLILHKKTLRGDVALFTEIALFFAVFATSYLTLGKGAWASARISAAALFYHISTIVLTTVAYRLSPLHPLWSFPGPLINKITSFKLLFVVWGGKRHLYIDGLHKKYGKFVRTGPNTLTIDSHDAISPIYASAGALDKSDAYIPGRMEGNGLFFIRSKDEHNVRRRLWAGAFTPQWLETYKPAIEKRTYELKTCIDSRRDKNGVVDLGEAIQHWSYDLMGDLTFGGSTRLELMQDGDPEGLVESGQQATILFESLGEVPSLFDLMTYLPVTRTIKKLETVAEKLLILRENDGSANQGDLVSHLLGHHSSMPKLNFADRRIDSLFAIQAGSDTTSGVFTYLFFLLITNQDAYKKLRAELDENFSDPDEPISASKLAELPYLNAVVMESLRLGTPLPGLPRVTPQSGMVLEGTYVPGGTIVGVNPYVQETSELNFYPDPMAYRPERWLPEGLGPGTITRKTAIMSFSSGAFGCLGRALAMQELQIVTTRLILAYDLSFAPKFDSKKFRDGVENMRTTIFRYPLTVVATSRK